MAIVDCMQNASARLLVLLTTSFAMHRFASCSSLLRHGGVGVQRLADDAVLPAS
jgi:hypothetical protein